ncbi:hypothetical protein GCM10027049_20070 [Mucilaginibacter puniceus]
MDDQFDDSLKKHISKAFENIEVPTADEGWLMLRKKFPEKEKDRPVVWLWRAAAVAAVIIVAFGIGTWVNYKNSDKETMATQLPKVDRLKKNNDQLANKTIPDAVIDSVAYPNNLSPGKKIAKQPVSKPYILPNNNRISATDNTDQPALDNYANTNLPASVIPDQTITNTTQTIIKDSTVNKPGQNIAKQQTVDPAVLPKTNSYTLPDNQPVAPVTDNEKKVKFGVYAATYLNYAKGSENQLNMGVGFTSDIKISKKVKLSTGVAIAQNSLNYTNQPASAPQNFLYNGAVSTNTAGTANAYNFVNAQSAPTIKDYNALLVGLDIPLNLKYEFNPQKNRNYIVVGLSSGTFINESYTYNFNTINTRNYAGGVALASNLQQQLESQTTKNSFSDFYFARTLNVSFGIGYPLGKNHLIIEPFLKYPLAGLGAQQIYFGAGGVNLKFDFQSSSKK